jgi:hypothetical protein
MRFLAGHVAATGGEQARKVGQGRDAPVRQPGDERVISPQVPHGPRRMWAASSPAALAGTRSLSRWSPT